MPGYLYRAALPSPVYRGMMINRIQIVDFQGLEDIDFECGPITVIHGESDVGKSAIVRALYGLAFNRYPRGHVREGAKESYVSVMVDDGIVTAVKGPGVNKYQFLAHNDAGELNWDKVGTEVPDAISDLLGWHEIEVDDGTKFTPNFSRQFDPPFLLTDSPSRRAKVLGSLTNVATLYAAAKMANTWERRGQSRIEAQQEIMVRTDPRIAELAHEVQFEQKLLSDLMAVLGRARELEIKIKEQRTLWGRMASAQELRTKAGAIVQQMAKVPDLSAADALIPRLMGMRALSDNMKLAAHEVQERRNAVVDLAEEVIIAEHAMEEFRAEAGGVCPICGSDWEVGHNVE